MTKRQKLIQKIMNGQKVAFSDIDNLLKNLDFDCRVNGSHHTYTKGSILVTLPYHGKEIKVIYLKLVSEALRKNGN